MVIENSEGEGSQKPKFFKGKYEAKLKLEKKGWGGRYQYR